MNLTIAPLSREPSPVEIVERKGLGHPDSICDALALRLSQSLCRHYRDAVGTILHHNVDKALLRGGQSAPAFGGGKVVQPIDIYLCGRAVLEWAGKSVPLDELAIEGSREWLRTHLHALHPERHVRLHNLVRHGSQELTSLFARGSAKGPLANDSSFGVGYAPLSPLEQLAIAVEQRLNGRRRDRVHPAWGEDIKVMALRRDRQVSITVACAMIDRHLSDVESYVAEKEAVRRLVEGIAAEMGFDNCQVRVNAADDVASGSIYLTVTGTSAESGDDGQVGRGNRVNGLITPFRPMSLEAAAGKNPVSHVGMIYNVLARETAERLVATLPVVAAAECYLASEIGAPVSSPAFIHVRIATRDGSPAGQLGDRVEEIVADELARLPSITDRFVAGSIGLY